MFALKSHLPAKDIRPHQRGVPLPQADNGSIFWQTKCTPITPDSGCQLTIYVLWLINYGKRIKYPPAYRAVIWAALIWIRRVTTRTKDHIDEAMCAGPCSLVNERMKDDPPLPTLAHVVRLLFSTQAQFPSIFRYRTARPQTHPNPDAQPHRLSLW